MDISTSTYSADADLDRDGDVDTTDYNNSSGTTPGLASGDLSSVDNIFGFGGYIYNPEIAVYTVRFRNYSTRCCRSNGTGRPLSWCASCRKFIAAPGLCILPARRRMLRHS